MSNRMNAPLTKTEAGGVSKPPKGKPIVCSKCGRYGGTLIKVDDHYEHQDKVKCRMFGG